MVARLNLFNKITNCQRDRRYCQPSKVVVASIHSNKSLISSWDKLSLFRRRSRSLFGSVKNRATLISAIVMPLASLYNIYLVDVSTCLGFVCFTHTRCTPFNFFVSQVQKRWMTSVFAQPPIIIVLDVCLIGPAKSPIMLPLFSLLH